MVKDDIIQHIVTNEFKDFDIFTLYAQFVKENGLTLFTGCGKFMRLLDDISQLNDIQNVSRLAPSILMDRARKFDRHFRYENTFARSFYEYVLSRLKNGDKVWDIGCGEHPLNTMYLNEQGVDITGIDPCINTKFVEYFGLKYKRAVIQSLEQSIQEENPSMLIGFRPCDGQEHLIRLAQKYDKSIITKACDCRLFTPDKQIIRGEADKTNYFLSKYPFLKRGSMFATQEDSDKLSSETCLDTVMEAYR